MISIAPHTCLAMYSVRFAANPWVAFSSIWIICLILEISKTMIVLSSNHSVLVSTLIVFWSPWVILFPNVLTLS